MPLSKFGCVAVGFNAPAAVGDRGLQVCNLVEIGSLTCLKSSSSPEELAKEISIEFCYPSTKEKGNILFAISTTQLQSPGAGLKQLLAHPHCRIVHHYYNNAHPPGNSVYLCMIHIDPVATKVGEWKNNIKEFQ